ncbi:MAG TPA: hypothetical protein VFJ88_06710, partial [Chthoniobacterales bacterium]|nr:hypothetical protein [Chthoniobacterales bacterium]
EAMGPIKAAKRLFAIRRYIDTGKATNKSVSNEIERAQGWEKLHRRSRVGRISLHPVALLAG